MKMSIRKAYALQKSIESSVMSPETMVSLNEFENPETVLTTLRTELTESDKKNEMLLKAVYTIRGLIAAANHKSGINDLLTKGAFIDRRITDISKYASMPSTPEINVIEGKLEKIRNNREPSKISVYRSSNDDEVDVSILNSEMVTHFKNTLKLLKKQKQIVNDEVLEKNVKTEIEIPADITELLHNENLI